MDTQLTNQEYVNEMEKEYNKLLENGDKGNMKLTDAQVDEITARLNKVTKDDPMLNMISKLPSNGGEKDAGYDGKLDSVSEEVTVQINPETGERVIVGSVKEKTEQEQEFITDTFEELWAQAEKSSTTDINKIKIPDSMIMEQASNQFDLTGNDMNIFLDLVKRYRESDGKIPNLYSKLPKAVKNLVDAGAADVANNISFDQIAAAKNNVAKIIMDSFISDVTMSKATVDFNTEMNKILSDANSTAKDLYYDSVIDKLKQIDLVIEQVNIGDNTEEEKKDKIDKLTRLAKAMNDAINLDDFKEKLPRIKIKKFEIEKPRRITQDFDNKYVSSVYSIHSVSLLFKVMYREFPDYSEEDITKFILSFCKYTMNMHPENVFEHTFMYYFVSNIIYLNSQTEFSDLENTIKENVTKCLDIIAKKAA